MGKFGKWLKKTDLTGTDKILIILLCILLIILGMIIEGIIQSVIYRNNEVKTAAETAASFTTKKIAPELTFFGEENGYWRYYVDEKTDIIYIVNYSKGYGITPAINADGTPMTRTQLLED
jgi:hypothetical protein